MPLMSPVELRTLRAVLLSWLVCLLFCVSTDRKVLLGYARIYSSTTMFFPFALTTAAAAASVVPARPAVMRFVSLVDSRFIFGDADLALGIEAAFMEANGTASAFGVTFQHDIIESSAVYSITQPYTAVNTANVFFNTIHNFTTDPNFYGFVGMSSFTAIALELLQKVTFQPHPPSFGPRLLTNSLSVRQQVAFRGEPLTEIPFLLAFAMHRSGLLCTQGAVFRPDTIPQARFTDFTKAFVASGFPAPTMFLRSVLGGTDYNRTAIRATLMSQPDACLFIFDTIEVASSIIEFVGATLGMPSRNMFLYSQSAGAAFSPAARPFMQNAYVSLQVPSASNQSTLMVRKARAAVLSAALRNASRPAAVLRQTSMHVVNGHHLEGYIVGRMVLQLLQSTVSVSRSALIDAAYTSRLQVDDFSLAALTDQCQEASNLPCFCNVAGRAYYIHRVNASDGELYGIEEDDTSAGNNEALTRKMVPTSSCLELTITLRRPFNVLALSPPAALSLLHRRRAAMATQAFAVMKLALAHRNDDLGDVGTMHLIHEALLSNGTTNVSIGSVTSSEAATLVPAAVSALGTRFRPFVVVGGEGAVSPSGLQLDPTPAALREEDSQWQQNTLFLEPAMSHYLHAVAARAGGDMIVIADSLRIAALAEASLNTFNARMLEAHIVNTTDTTATTLTAATGCVRQALAAGQRAVVASNDPSVVSAMLRAAQDALAPVSAAATALPSTAALFIVAHELVLQEGVASAGLSSASALAATSHAFVRFTSIHDPWWTNGTGAVGTLLQALYRRPTAADVAEIKGIYQAEAVFALSANAVVLGAGASASQSVSALSTVSAAGITLGPFYLQACTSAAMGLYGSQYFRRQCECSTGPRRFILYDLRDLLTRASTTAVNGSTALSYTLDGCGFETQPLAASLRSSDDTAFIVGVTAGPAGAVILLLVVAVALVLICSGRSHRHAPTNVDEPFAIVFTDIQSSTALWARAPAAMSRAVEDHHLIIRALIKKHRGYEVKTIGDSFMVAFKHPEHAAALGVDIQRALFEAAWPPEIDGVYKALTMERAEEEAAAEELRTVGKRKASTANPEAQNREGPTTPFAATATAAVRLCLPEHAHEYNDRWCGLRVRVGVHFGHGTISRDQTTGSYDYYGTVVNTAARIEGVGHGGQTLLSQDAFGALPTAYAHEALGATTVALGPQPLRGLDVPIALVLLAPLELAARTFPPLRLDVDHAQAVVGVDDSTATATPSAVGSMSMRSGQAAMLSNSGSTDNSNATKQLQTPADALQRSARRLCLPPDLIEKHVAVVKMLLATSSDKAQREMVASLMRQWHVAPCKTAGPVVNVPPSGHHNNHHRASAISAAGSATVASTQILSAPVAHEINVIHLVAKVLKASEARGDAVSVAALDMSANLQSTHNPPQQQLFSASHNPQSMSVRGDHDSPFTPEQ